MNIDLAIERMRELSRNTHILFNEQGAKYYTEPFGIEPKLFKYEADAGPDNPKGLTLNDGAKSAMGIASWDLAYQIYRHFKLEDVRGYLGRGSQQRAYCDAVIMHLLKVQKQERV